MTEEIRIINRFYSSLNKLDADGMNSCYSENIIFSDPVFGVLHGKEAKSMWEMLCYKAEDFSLIFQSPEDKGDGYFTCTWQAIYRFSKTGKMVTNKGKAFMKLENGFICEHSDAFSLQRWISQAFGITGFILGRIGFFQRKIRNEARAGLEKWMAKNES